MVRVPAFTLGTGLHSYGFGAGGYTWIGGFVAFEALVIVAAFVRKHRAAAAPAVALAARAVGVVLLAILFVACASAPAPVRLEAAPADLRALAGEWEGEYSSAATGRSGSIVFKLIAGEDHAHGDVVMMPSGAHRAYGPMRDTRGPVSPADLAQVLSIAFVRVAGGGVSGTLEPYRDPDCDCEACTTFSGVVHDGTIEGSFVTVSRGARGTLGHWKVVRKR